MASPVTHSTDDVIIDSEDEASEKVKGRVSTFLVYLHAKHLIKQ